MYVRESVAFWLEIINALVWKNSIKWDFYNNNINSKSITRKQSHFCVSQALFPSAIDSTDPNSHNTALSDRGGGSNYSPVYTWLILLLTLKVTRKYIYIYKKRLIFIREIKSKYLLSNEKTKYTFRKHVYTLQQYSSFKTLLCIS